LAARYRTISADDRELGLTEDFLGLFGKDPEGVTLAAGESLFEKGEPGHLMYVVKSGDLQIIDGNHVYETVSAGGNLGEMALIDAGPRSATVRAIRQSIVIPIDERRFPPPPFFALRVMRVLTARLRAMNERVKVTE